MEPTFFSDETIHVACDTGVFREIIHNTVPWLSDFQKMARNGVRFSLADHTFPEIVNQLEQNQITDQEYQKGIEGLTTFISQDVPFLPGKKQLLMWCDSASSRTERADILLHGRKIWKLMKRSKNFSDWQKGLTYYSHNQHLRIHLKPNAAHDALEDEREKWINHIKKPRADWGRMRMEDRLSMLAGDLHSDLNCIPNLTTRLDAALRHEDEIIKLYNKNGSPLNPESDNRKNDGIDYNMSYVFMKQILLCTCETSGYNPMIRRLKSFQSTWIFSPQELVAAWKGGVLSKPIWPQ